MIVDTYRNFVEISGLQGKIAQHEANIQSENKRIDSLVTKREQTQLQIKELELKIHNLNLKNIELETITLEQKLSKLKDQVSLVKNDKELNSINHEIEFTSKKLNEAEEIYFKNNDEFEIFQNAIKELNAFLEGSKSTLLEITNEANQIISKEKNEIANYQNRINALLETESPSTQKLFKEINLKFKTTTPFTRMNGKNCSACRINIDVQTVNLVENCASLEFCPNCGRLLLPTDTNLYR